MLKIRFSETPSEERWTLHGRLTAPWVRELRTLWKKNHRRDKQRVCIVDLNEITFIDKSGERLLRHLVREGAQCIATGVYVKHVLQQLAAKGKGSILNRLTGFFLGALVAGFGLLVGAQYIVPGIYVKHVIQPHLATKSKGAVLNRLTGF